MGWKPDHKRIKPKYKPWLKKAERRHKGYIKSLPCIGCGIQGISEAHHVLADAPDKRWRRDHWFLVPACPDCHRGPDGIHGTGNEAEWAAARGLDLLAAARSYREERLAA